MQRVSGNSANVRRCCASGCWWRWSPSGPPSAHPAGPSRHSTDRTKPRTPARVWVKMNDMAPRLPHLPRTATTALALLTSALLATGAHAATVSVPPAEPGRGGSGVEAHVLYIADPGERNDVSLTADATADP